MMEKRKYLMSSERAAFRSDERDNVIDTTKELDVGDAIILDGIFWYVTEVL